MKNGPKLSGKLISHNPAVWAAIAENILKRQIFSVSCTPLAALSLLTVPWVIALTWPARKLLQDYSRCYRGLEDGEEQRYAQD